MNRLHRIACGVSCHGELVVAALHLVGHLCRHDYLAVDVTLQSNGDKFIWVRSIILSCEGRPVANKMVVDEGTVQIQFSTIFTGIPLVFINDQEGAQGLIEL